MWKRMSLTGRNRSSLVGSQRDSNHTARHREAWSAVEIERQEGGGEESVAEVLGLPCCLILVSQTYRPSNSHYILRSLPLAMSAVICIWVNNLS